MLPEMLATEVPTGLQPYRAGRNVARAGEALCFFVDDYRFSCAWTYPRRMVASLLERGWSVACEPDFSAWRDMPRAEQLHAVYRSRWCGRFWQEHGIRIIPVGNWSDRSSYDWCFDGVPSGVAVVAVEYRPHPLWRGEWLSGYRELLSRWRPGVVLVYGRIDDELAAIGSVELREYAAFTPTRGHAAHLLGGGC